MPQHDAIYTSESAMEPLMPTDSSGQLREASARLLSESARLAGALHPATQQQVAELVCKMNSYYSNLIEGHHTHPADIEKALQRDFSSEPAQRALQLESAAHIQVEALMRERIADASAICSEEFVRWLHREFYQRMPVEFRLVGETKTPIDPGEYRVREVTVGTHLAPAVSSLPRLMTRFAWYEPNRFDPLDRIIAAAAAHHRFAWIHPFQDGNGRVGRLLSQACLAKSGLETGGLWALSRGLARRRDAYRAALAAADAQRRNDLDGRGNLSNEALVSFCQFFIATARDQVSFMAELLDLDAMQHRLERFAARWSTLHDAPPGLGRLLRAAFLQGALSRGEAAAALGMHERTARRHLAQLVGEGLLQTAAPGAPVAVAFSPATVGYLFPRLYPEGVELSSETR